MTDHTDGAPAWDGCELVRDQNGDLWTIRYDPDCDCTVYICSAWWNEYPAAEVEARVGPCTPVLGPEGEPVITPTDIDEITDVLLNVQYPSRADVERAAKSRLYVWDPK